MAMMLRINEIKSKSGSLKNLNLEILDSNTATNRHNINIFIMTTTSAIQ